MTPAHVLERVHRIFREDLQLDIEADVDVIGSGVLDSLVFVQLLVRLEEEFGLTVDMETLELDDFRSVASIARHVGASLRDA